MKKINLAVTGCMGRMGQQIIKSAKTDKNFKLIALTENKIIKKKINGIKLNLNTEQAFKKADASALMPFDFLRLPVAALFGYFLFSETLDVWSWGGAVIIFTASYYTVRREKLNARVC